MRPDRGWAWKSAVPSLLAVGVLAGCGGGGGNAVPPPPEAGRIGADRQVGASPLAGDRRRARHDAEDGARDEARGQPIGSIVPPEPPGARQLPPLPPPEGDVKL